MKTGNRTLAFCAMLAVILSIILLYGCKSRQGGLLQETTWYADSMKWYAALSSKRKGLNIDTPSVWIGKVKGVEYDPKGRLSSISLEHAECLKPRSFFPKEIRLWPAPQALGSMTPAVGEYWAFRVIRGLKGELRTVAAAKVIYDDCPDALLVVDPAAVKNP